MLKRLEDVFFSVVGCFFFLSCPLMTHKFQPCIKYILERALHCEPGQLRLYIFMDRVLYSPVALAAFLH